MYNNALYMYNSALYSTMDRALYMDNSSHTGYVGCCTRENSTLYKGDNRLQVSVNKCAASGPVSSGPRYPLDLVSSSVAFSYSGLPTWEVSHGSVCNILESSGSPPQMRSKLQTNYNYK